MSVPKHSDTINVSKQVKKMMFQSKINLQRNNTGVIKNMYIGKYYDESMEKNSVEK